MKASCTLSQTGNGSWTIRHSSSALGDVELTAASRDEALAGMQNELQYRSELCPCSGESVGTVELQVNEALVPGRDG